MPSLCDHKVVGVLIRNGAGEYLMFRRGTPPVGIAPVAGHVDDHGGFEAAARAEVSEEVGLTVVKLRPAMTAQRANACRRDPGVLSHGHHWEVFYADVEGDLAPSAREVAGEPMWLGPDALQQITDRTIAYAHGQITDNEFAADPGLEPVWVGLLAALGTVHVGGEDREAVNLIARRPPRT